MRDRLAFSDAVGTVAGCAVAQTSQAADPMVLRKAAGRLTAAK